MSWHRFSYKPEYKLMAARLRSSVNKTWQSKGSNNCPIALEFQFINKLDR